jgi:hypothetical protein
MFIRHKTKDADLMMSSRCFVSAVDVNIFTVGAADAIEERKKVSGFSVLENYTIHASCLQ